MAVFNEPTKWQTSLVNSGDANTIPQSTPAGSGEASFNDGFPQITQVPIGAGGIAPDRKDFNGLFKILGDWIFFNQNGGVSTYSESFDYVAGRVVSYNANIYKCIQANGVSSTVVTPDSNTEYWQRLDNYVRSVNGVNADTQGNVTIQAGSSIPDYTTGVTKSVNVENTAEYDGWLLAQNSADDCGLYVTVNNAFKYSSFTGTNVVDAITLSVFIPIAKGDVYKVTGQGVAGNYSLSCMFFKMR